MVKQRKSEAVTKSIKKNAPEVKVNGVGGRGRRATKRSLDVVVSPTTVKNKKIKVDLASPLIKDGKVLTVGMGDIGQLGLGPDVEEKTRTAVVPDLPNIVAIAGGGLHTVCISDEGKVFTWGCNDEGGLGRITTNEDDNFSCGEVCVPGTAVQVTAGDCHTVALTNEGLVYAWGSFRDNSGPLGFLEAGTLQKTPRQLLEDIPVVKVVSGHNHMVFLTKNGHLYTCGNGESGQLGRIAEVFACRDSRNRNGIETLLVPKLVKVYRKRKMVVFDDVWAGGLATFARAKDTGYIYGFGLNNYCQLGDEDTNMKFQPVLLKAFKGKKWKMFAAGQHHSVALDEDGKVFTMGRREYGRLGLGENCSDAGIPTLVPGLANKTTISISAGEAVTLAVTDEGIAYGFGMGTSNQLSQGDEEDRWVPTILSGKQLNDRKVIDASAGGQHTVLLATAK